MTVVGAPRDNDACPAGPECDSGSAYVFRWDGLSWVQEAKFVASDAVAGDRFRKVSVSGNVVVVGGGGSAYVYQMPWMPCSQSCPWDCGDGNGEVGINDFLTMLANWGIPGPCDFDGGGVGITDFLELLAFWGPCP